MQPEATLRVAPVATTAGLPHGLTGLLTQLGATTSGVGVHRVAKGRYIAYLPGPDGGRSARLRLVGGDLSSYSRKVRETLTRVITDHDARVMLVGSSPGGLVAAELAAGRPTPGFTI